MKRLTILLLVGICAVAGTTWAQSGLGLSIKPGFIINAAHIGYKSDNLFIGGGLEFASASLSHNYEHIHRDSWEGRETTYTVKSETKTDVSVFLPQVAAKAFLGSRDEDAAASGYARPYLWASVFYSLAGARCSYTDEDTTYQEVEWEKQVRDALGGNVGGAVAFGGEYYIATSLSLSGEFGCRFIFGDTKREVTREYEHSTDVYKYADKLGLGFTYTTLGLNFYF
ncbi:hypothetical protein FJY69_05960 [candidate division WOR-3 bacterium]|nr:hypothetical protein [candidate division WOR-3 bacterium]